MKYPSVLLALALVALLPASAIAYRLLPEERLAEAVQVRALRYGDTGDEVVTLQELLHARGFDPGPVDGIFGPLTEAAVRTAQRHFGLEVDGLAGRLTVGALREQDRNAPVAIANEAPPDPASGVAGEEAVPGGIEGSEGTASGTAAGPAAGTSLIGSAFSAQGTGPIEARSGLRIYQAEQGDPFGAAPADTRGEVALTFHHLPAPQVLDGLLALLDEAGVRATFFVTGEQALERPADLRRIRTLGHAIGSLGNRVVDMRELGPAEARVELQMAREAILAASGEAPQVFRPPLGRFDRQLIALVEEEGMEFLLWSNAALFVEPGITPERLAEQAGRALYPGAVLMLPLDEPAGAAAVAPLLDRTRGAGYRIAPLAQIGSPRGVALSTNRAR